MHLGSNPTPAAKEPEAAAAPCPPFPPGPCPCQRPFFWGELQLHSVWGVSIAIAQACQDFPTPCELVQSAAGHTAVLLWCRELGDLSYLQSGPLCVAGMRKNETCASSAWGTVDTPETYFILPRCPEDNWKRTSKGVTLSGPAPGMAGEARAVRHLQVYGPVSLHFSLSAYWQGIWDLKKSQGHRHPVRETQGSQRTFSQFSLGSREPATLGICTDPVSASTWERPARKRDAFSV